MLIGSWNDILLEESDAIILYAVGDIARAVLCHSVMLEVQENVVIMLQQNPKIVCQASEMCICPGRQCRIQEALEEPG